MFKILRNKIPAKRIWIFLALIIMPALVFWGLGCSPSGQKNGKPAGKIFGRQITSLQLKNALKGTTTAAIMQYGDRFPEMQKYLNLEAQAWQRLILLAEAQKLSIEASGQEVTQIIENLPYFQYKGNFDSKTYAQTVENAFHSKPVEFEEQTRQNIIMSKLYKKITDDLSVNEKEILKEYEKANQEISVYYICSLPADFIKNIESGDREAKALKLAEQKINECAKELESQEFKQAAKKCGLQVKETSLFKFGSDIEGIDASNIFWNTAKSLHGTAHSKIISLPSGFYIIQVKSISRIDKKKFEQEKNELGKNLLEQKKQEKFTAFLTELNKKAALY